MKTIALALMGITGKMGQRIASLALQEKEFTLVGGIAKDNSPWIGKDIGTLLRLPPLGVVVEKDPFLFAAKADVWIDFSAPAALSLSLEIACHFQKPLLIGTTGLSGQDIDQIEKASSQIPILYAANFSFGIALCKKILQTIPQSFLEASDLYIMEEHHSKKKDSPSGTALSLAKSLQEKAPKKMIAFHSIRAGSTIGTHSICLVSGEERIEIRHEAFSRDLFAKGALSAAKFLYQKPPKLYSIEDVLFERSSYVSP